MIVTFDPSINFEWLYYVPNVKHRNLKAYASIEEYAEAHAQQASSTQNTNMQNTQTVQNTQENQNVQQTKKDITDYNALIEMLKLNLPENKFAILSLIPASELVQFIQLLNKDQLLSSLKLFTKDKILQFIANIPKEDLLKLLFKIFVSKDQILEMLPIKELNRFLSSKKIAKGDLIKIFQSFSRTELAQIAEAATGIPQGNKSQVQLLKYIEGLKTRQILDGVKGLEYKKMRNVVSEILKLDPSMYMEFSKGSLFELTINFPKTSLIEGMGVLNENQLAEMVSELPQRLMALAVTQIETELLSQILVNDYQNLLGQIT